MAPLYPLQRANGSQSAEAFSLGVGACSGKEKLWQRRRKKSASPLPGGLLGTVGREGMGHGEPHRHLTTALPRAIHPDSFGDSWKNLTNRQLPTSLGLSVVFHHVQLFVTLWAVALQALLSLGFPRLEYWTRLLFPSPGDLLNPWMDWRTSLHWRTYSLSLSHCRSPAQA